MDYKQQMEYAATALGLVVCWDEFAGCWVPEKGPMFWDPLSEDRDAFKLLVVLKLSVEIIGCQVYVRRDGQLLFNGFALNDNDFEMREATRRSIVYASAVIGSQLNSPSK